MCLVSVEATLHLWSCSRFLVFSGADSAPLMKLNAWFLWTKAARDMLGATRHVTCAELLGTWHARSYSALATKWFWDVSLQVSVWIGFVVLWPSLLPWPWLCSVCMLVYAEMCIKIPASAVHIVDSLRGSCFTRRGVISHHIFMYFSYVSRHTFKFTCHDVCFTRHFCAFYSKSNQIFLF